MVIPAAGYFSDPARTNGEAKAALDALLEYARGIGPYSNLVQLTVSTTLSGAHVGALVDFYGIASATMALPPASSVTPGKGITLLHTGAAGSIVTVTAASGDLIYAPSAVGVQPLGSVQVRLGDYITVISSGSGWLVTSPSAATNIYANPATFRMPGGLLLQMGTAAVSGSIAAGGYASVSVTFPTAFPTRCMVVCANPLTNSGISIQTGGQSQNGFTAIASNNTGSAQSNNALNYLAIGW